MKTILFVTPTYFSDRSFIGGGERLPLNQARGVVAAGKGRYRVLIVSYGEEPGIRQLEPNLSLAILTNHAAHENPMEAASWEILDAVQMADLVHIHQAFTRSSETAIVAASAAGKPIVVTDHGGVQSPLGQGLDMLDLASAVACQSEFATRMIRTSAPVHIIRGGVDADYFSPAKSARDRVLFVGRLLPHKGVDLLIEALPEEVPLTVCGRPYGKAYHDHLRKIAAGKRVEFITDADDETIRSLYRRAVCTVLPSVYKDYEGKAYTMPELMGLTLLESMACGTPAVCNCVAAMPEFVEDGVTGFVFQDRAQLSERLLQLWRDAALVSRLGAQARAKTLREYDYRAVGQKLLSLYESVLSSPRALRQASSVLQP